MGGVGGTEEMCTLYAVVVLWFMVLGDKFNDSAPSTGVL